MYVTGKTGSSSDLFIFSLLLLAVSYSPPMLVTVNTVLPLQHTYNIHVLQ